MFVDWTTAVVVVEEEEEEEDDDDDDDDDIVVVVVVVVVGGGGGGLKKHVREIVGLKKWSTCWHVGHRRPWLNQRAWQTSSLSCFDLPSTPISHGVAGQHWGRLEEPTYELVDLVGLSPSYN